MPRIAHIINPFRAEPSSDLYTAQPITFQSMINAREKAKGSVDVDLLSAQFVEDMPMVPKEFKLTKHLKRSILDCGEFEKQLKLPLLHDILQALYNESDADYLIYTNVDIGLYPDFYLKVNEFINLGYDAFIITRRRISGDYASVSQLDAIYKETGKKHPGFDCFVFHRNLFPKLKLQGICIGVPFIEISFSQNLFALSNNFRLFEDEQLTFHIGMEIFKKRAPREFFRYNRRQFHKLEKELLPHMRLDKFPYSDKNWLLRFIKYGLHPCIPIRLVIKLWLRRLFRKTLANPKLPG